MYKNKNFFAKNILSRITEPYKWKKKKGSECNQSLNLKTYRLHPSTGKLYCVTHLPKEKATPTGLDNVQLKSAVNAPKKKAEGLQVAHKGAKELAPKSSGDFTVNDVNKDQSTENNPQESNIAYEEHHGDQSTENNPQESNITYEEQQQDQSTEN